MNTQSRQPCVRGSWLRRLFAVAVGALFCGAGAADAATFFNPSNIAINPAGGPNAAPYPSSIPVTGLSGVITNVTVVITNLSHTNPDDLDILLVGPNGREVMLMSDAGGPNDISGVRLTFSDDIAAVLHDTNRITTGTYRPTNYAPTETLPTSAPPPPYGNSFSVFDGINPNGTWRLYVFDDTSSGGSGLIAGGWQLNLGVAVFPPVITNHPQDQIVEVGGTAAFQVSATGTPPLSYQWMRNGAVFIPFGQGGPTLTLLDVTAADAGIYYVLVANAANPNGVRSEDARLTVVPRLAIASQPQDQTVEAGGSATFEVSVTGAPPFTYQWFRGGAVSVPIGQGGPTLTLSNVTAADAGAYYVLVSNATHPNGVRSSNALLQVVAPLTIVTQPQDQTVAPGGTATFQVGVTGLPPFGYQWYHNGQIVVPFGQGGPTLSIANVGPNRAGNYFVIVTNAGTPAGMRSADAFLNVLGPLTIVQSPSSVTVQPGDQVRLCVVAAGRPPIRYQWTLNGQFLPDRVDSCLDLPNIDVKGGGSFQVIVSNADGALTTEPAVVVVRPDVLEPSPTDKFVDRPALQVEQGVIQGNNERDSTEPGELTLRGGGRTRWFEWIAPDDGIATFGARGSAFDTLLAVYVGSRVEQLTLVAKDDDRGGFYTSSLQFNARRGRAYQIQIDGFGFDGAGGPFTVCWSMERTTELVPVILDEPAPQGVKPGGVATFRVQTDDQPVQYQWLFNGRPIPGATESSYTVFNAQRHHVGRYSVRLRNQFDRVLVSEEAGLQLGSFNFPVASDKLENVLFAYRDGRTSAGGAGGADGGFVAASGGSFGAGYMSIGLGDLVYNVSDETAYLQSGDRAPCGNPVSSTIWSGLTATNTGIIQVDTVGSDVLMRLAVYRLATNTPNALGVEIVCDVTSAANGQPVIKTFNAQRGSNYLVVLARQDTNASGQFQLNAKMGIAPALHNPLQYCLVAEGGSITLSMPATNWCPLPTCQWMSNGVAIPGATGPTLLVDGFHIGKVGTYSVTLSNFVRTTTRDVAYLALAGPFVLGHWWTTNETDVGFVINASNAYPFVLQTSTDLNGTWTPVATNPDPCLFLLYTNPGALLEPRRFFRAAPWTPPGP